MLAITKGITFFESLNNFEPTQNAGNVLHILCLNGSLGFTFADTYYNTVKYDYVILPDVSLASNLKESNDFQAIIMSLDAKFVSSIAVGSNYGVIGHLSLLQNPVMKLSLSEYENCKTDLLRLKTRIKDTEHLFYEELINDLLSAHILDLYNIHAKKRIDGNISERKTVLLRNFIKLLYDGAFIEHRDLKYYAEKLFITEHYLSEICKEISKKPASYWIDRFTIQEIVKLLYKKQLSLNEIADKFKFSSLSYFCRYVRQKTGKTPNALRNKI